MITDIGANMCEHNANMFPNVEHNVEQVANIMRTSQRSYFRRNGEIGNYEKSCIIRGKEYILSIKEKDWTPSTSKAVSRWLKQVENEKCQLRFRWGIITEVKTDSDESSPKSPKVTYTSNDKTDVISIETDIESDTVYSCVGCGLTYTSRSGLWKHEQNCKALTVSSTEKKNIREINGLGGIKMTDIPPGGISIQNNTQNIQNINISLREFGNENPNWLTENMLYSLIGNVSKAIPMMMQKKHFNEDFPENMNLRLNNRNDINLRLQVWEGGKWRIRDSKQTFYKVVIDIYDILSDALNEEDDEYDDEADSSIHPEIRKARRSQRFLDKVKRIKPLWEEFREKLETQSHGDNEVLIGLWEDLKTFLLDRKLCLEQDKTSS